jgi:hypothetical protein
MEHIKIHKYTNILKVISLNYNPYNSCNLKVRGCKILCVYTQSLVFLLWMHPNGLQKHHKIEGIKHNLWIVTMFLSRQWDKFHLKAWLWLRGKPFQRYVQFDMGCDLAQYGNKVETIVGIHL